MKRTAWYLGAVALAAVISVSVQYYPAYHGFGSAFPWEPAILVLVLALFAAHYRLNNCHVDGCLRLGKYPVAGGHWNVCRGHHPESHVRHKRVTFEHIQALHAIHLLRTGAGRLPSGKKDHT